VLNENKNLSPMWPRGESAVVLAVALTFFCVHHLTEVKF